MKNDWIRHVKQFARQHNISYKDALKNAGSTYIKGRGVGSSSATVAPSDGDPDEAELNATPAAANDLGDINLNFEEVSNIQPVSDQQIRDYLEALVKEIYGQHVVRNPNYRRYISMLFNDGFIRDVAQQILNGTQNFRYRLRDRDDAIRLIENRIIREEYILNDVGYGEMRAFRSRQDEFFNRPDVSQLLQRIYNMFVVSFEQDEQPFNDEDYDAFKNDNVIRRLIIQRINVDGGDENMIAIFERMETIFRRRGHNV
jgi:hypothetical protein